MEIKGRYTAIIKDQDGRIVEEHKTPNVVVALGKQQVVDWLLTDMYGSNSYPVWKEIDVSGATVTEGGAWTDSGNILDGNINTWGEQDVSSTSYDVNFFQVNFASPVDIAAIYLNWYEEVDTRGLHYRYDYSTNNGANWTQPPCYGYNCPNEIVTSVDRKKQIYVLNDGLEIKPITGVTNFRLNMKHSGGAQYTYIYDMKFLAPNFTPQGPYKLALGTDDTTPDPSGTALNAQYIQKMVNTMVQPSGYTVRYVATLDFDEGNGVSYKEAGMFYNNDSNLKPDITGSDKMFSHALWDTPWSKTSGQTVDVYYEIDVI